MIPSAQVGPEEQEANIPPVDDAITVQNISSGKDPVVNSVMIIGGTEEDAKQAGQNMTHSTVQVLSVAATGQHKPDSNVRKVIIKYPDNFKGQRYFKDGDVKTVSKECAAQFIKQGIATPYKK